jgi:hypothetical protein
MTLLGRSGFGRSTIGAGIGDLGQGQFGVRRFIAALVFVCDCRGRKNNSGDKAPHSKSVY